MKTNCKRMDDSIYSFLRHFSVHLCPQGRCCPTSCTWGWVQPRAAVDKPLRTYCPCRESNPFRLFLSQPLFWANQAPFCDLTKTLFIIINTVDILAQTPATNKAGVTDNLPYLSVISVLSWSKQTFLIARGTAGVPVILFVWPRQFLNTPGGCAF